jgi:hypothetical protein
MSYDSPQPVPDQPQPGMHAAAIKEIAAGVKSTSFIKPQQTDLTASPSTKDFPIILTSFQQEGKAQAPDKSQDKPKSEPGKDQGKPDAPKDKPMTKEEQIKDARERGQLLLKDAAAGEWSAKSQETWRKLFDDIKNTPGITASEAHDAFNHVGAEINKLLEKQGVKHRVGMADVIDPATGETTIFMQINGAKTRAANALDALQGVSTPTNAKAGTAKFAPEKEEPKPQPKTKNRTA